jgi:peptidoglycan hydrolase-like protein with peptidoglycan-binding domain
VPIKWYLRWSRTRDALIQYTVCAEISNATIQEAVLFLALRLLLVMLALSRNPAFAAAAAGVIVLLRSPLTASVGRNGANVQSDARYVQILLNDWRGRNNLAAIGVDGRVGPQTIGAIEAFQRAETGIVDGRVDAGGPAIGALERLHVQSVPASIPGDFLVPDKRSEIMDDVALTQLLATDEDGTPLDVVAAVTGEAEAYLQALHDTVLVFP